jgi:hypothetical protein
LIDIESTKRNDLISGQCDIIKTLSNWMPPAVKFFVISFDFDTFLL